VESLFDIAVPLSMHDPSLMAECRGKVGYTSLILQRSFNCGTLQLSQTYPELFEDSDLSATDRHDRMEAAVNYGKNHFRYLRKNLLRAENEAHSENRTSEPVPKKLKVWVHLKLK
jgi:hypothetical protein